MYSSRQSRSGAIRDHERVAIRSSAGRASRPYAVIMTESHERDEIDPLTQAEGRLQAARLIPPVFGLANLGGHVPGTERHLRAV